MVWRPWRLFDPYLSRRENVVSGGYASERPGGAQASLGGFEGTFGQTIEAGTGALKVRPEVEWGFRWTGGGHCVFVLPRYSYTVGVLVGPVEVTSRVSSTLAEVHVGSGGFGAGLFSPRVGVGAAVHIGPIRLGAVLFSEYAWRWFGGPNARVKGLLFEASLVDLSHPLPSRYRVEK